MRTIFSAVLIAACMTTAAVAQYSSDFEAVTASDVGVVLTGQDAYYIPAGTTSVDFLAYTYAGNALGLPANPTGGAQFVGGTGPAGGAFARAQRDVSYAASSVWTVSYDVAPSYVGVLPAANNIGSLSTQVFPSEATFIQLVAWTDPATATNWNADAVWFDAAGTQILESMPVAEFQGLDANQWYRQTATFDLLTNRVLEVTVTDLTTATTVTYSPPDRYLFGGSAGAPEPTGFRFFAGSTTVGNVLAFDNIDIATEGGGGPTVVSPGAFEVTRGEYVAGGLPELAVGGDDNNDLQLRRLGTDVQSRTEFEITSVSTTETPTRFEFTLEGSAFYRAGVTQTIEFFDYDLGDWELVDKRPASQFVDSTTTVIATDDLSRFVEAGTRTIAARIHYQSANPRQVFATNTDQTVWTIE